jgi:hypothetical protein
MADEFDRLLAAALAPQERAPDRHFVARVQAAILLEERLAAQRSSLIQDLAWQLVALAAVAAALSWLGRADAVAGLAAESPAVALAILLVLFTFVAAVLSSRPRALPNSPTAV